jgi:hypothetical protein
MELALAALLTEPTIAAAAKKSGLGERTLRAWLKTPIFGAAFKDRCRAILDAATSALSAAMPDAVECLRRNLTCGNPAVEIRAAAAILGHGVRAAELMGVVKRLDERAPTQVVNIVENVVDNAAAVQRVLDEYGDVIRNERFGNQNGTGKPQ